MSLLYSLALGNRVIVCSISVVLQLRILIDTPYLAEFVVAFLGEVTILWVSVIHVPLGGKVGYMVLGLSTL